MEDGAMPVGGGSRKCEVERIGIGWLVGEVGLDTRHGPIEGSDGMDLGSAWWCRMGCVAKENTGTVPHEDSRRDPMNCTGTGTVAGKGSSSCGVAMERGTTQ